ncbi:hypothetical protein BDZ94DRAFT_1311300 [Collybia nuda]|uniref:T6SS Phospholipase effector Tle1-like catalytic domain-containing protein n=1 Tax=Collybia nuda TaxID=64659 RepID=A0A9P5Y1R5_9AGAR|nr:hypothetical protein BDZ94DRAFT_1311300 [Collybia nuda]
MSIRKSDYSFEEVGHDATIPPDHPYRTLVLCFDGTGNGIGKHHTNLSQLFSMLKKDGPSKQMIYYQTGIGTYTTQRHGPIVSFIAKTLGSMVGREIDSHIKDGYEFLMHNYRTNHRICIFGFSRGAYTARALAGMIHKVGLLPPSNRQHIAYVYDAFLRTDKDGTEATIEFVGTWDSVGSIGVGMPGPLFSTANTTIKTFRHAFSLDERRVRFQANVRTCYENEKSSKSQGRFRPSGEKEDQIELGTGHSSKEQKTDVEEVWFSGCHSDVGDDAVPHVTRHSLARIYLRWMIRQCFLTDTGIMFLAKAMRDHCDNHLG